MRKIRIIFFAGFLKLLGFLLAVSKPLGITRIYCWIIGYFIQRTGLFDATYYKNSIAPNQLRRLTPLKHYLLEGDAAFYRPSQYFDPLFYSQAVGLDALRVNTLLHYAYWGRFHKVSPSPGFDIKYYLECNPDVEQSGMDPLLHFIRHGRAEGRLPRPAVNTGSSQQITSANEILKPPTSNEWDAIRKRDHSAPPQVDVIIPVYGAAALTLRCIWSVLANGQKALYELVVVDDCSPDANLRDELDNLAARGLITLIRNDVNRGFVASVNRGLCLHLGRDVVILNSDTEVYGDWLDRLRIAATSSSKIATVTPMSNNATICSYPIFNQDNTEPLEISYEELDALASKANSGQLIEAPTGVGFCMYIARACLEKIGIFDEQNFGRGYGEENDFCQRAIKAGWINVIAGNIFVRHWGSSSFQGEKRERIREALQTIARLHPSYHLDVRKFIEADKMQPVRAALDCERLVRQMCGKRNVLVVTHGLGGGTERHIQEDIATMADKHWGAIILRPIGNGEWGRVSHGKAISLPNLSPFSLEDSGKLIEFLRAMHITDVHIHSLIGFSKLMPSRILSISSALGASLEFNVHDYACICPRINLVGPNGRYCGEPNNEDACNRCLAYDRKSEETGDILSWRKYYAALLSAASRVDVPDDDVKLRLERYFPSVNISVTPHESLNYDMARCKEPVLNDDAPLHVVTIGAISGIKGYQEFLACAKNAAQSHLPIRFTVLGHSVNDRALEAAGVEVTGRYLDSEASERLSALIPHIVWLPSICPETYSYTLSLAIEGKYPIAAYDIGAIASRLKRMGMADLLVPLEYQEDPVKWNDFFLAYRQRALASGADGSRYGVH